jgi:hypothetical protein
MFTDTLITAAVIAALSLLARITLREKPVEALVDRLPYLLQKPITCGVCRTFWMTFISQFLFNTQIQNYSQIFQAYIQGLPSTPVTFLVSWMITAMLAVSMLYIFLTFYEGSHYLTHKAEEMHS